MSIFANSEDPDEMPQGLNCMQRSTEKEVQYFVSKSMEKFIGLQSVKE